MPETDAAKLDPRFAEVGISQEDATYYATHPRQFIEKFIKNPETGEPYRLNRLQVRMFKALEKRVRRVATNAHRRGGKTASSILMVLFLLMTQPNTHILFIAPFNNQIEVFFVELDKFIAYHPWIAECVVKTTQAPYRKHFANGAILRGITTGSKSKAAAGSARGQTAQYIFLDEVAFMSDEDFASLKPIIMGDPYHAPPITFATSTPMAAMGQFYKWCTEADNGWLKIHYTLLENPDKTDEEKEEIRSQVSEREWQTEYLCEFLNFGGTAFNLAKLKECQNENLHYPVFPKFLPLPPLIPNPARPGEMQKVFWRTMGVDWDKHNKDGSGPTIAILDCDERPGKAGKIRVVYRESIPQSEYVYTETVQHIIDLNRLWNPDRIYVDGGQGDSQIESLHKEGIAHPDSGLLEKVSRQMFGSKLEIQDPKGGIIKKWYKNFLVNLLAKWLEGNILEYPKDRVLLEQFTEYRVLGVTKDGQEMYSRVNEHIIDAVGLAAVAMFQIHSSPFRHAMTSHSVVLPPQPVVAGANITDAEMRALRLRNPEAAVLVARDRPGRDEDAPQRVTRTLPGSRHYRPTSPLMTRRRRPTF